MNEIQSPRRKVLEKVKSPKTGRWITKDGKEYKKLVKEGYKFKGVPKKDVEMLVNPLSGRMMKKGGRTYEKVEEFDVDMRPPTYKQKALYSQTKYRNPSKYQELPESVFCGREGGAGPRTFPINSPRRCSAALTYANRAPYPEGIRRCALRKAQEQGWPCGRFSKFK